MESHWIYISDGLNIPKGSYFIKAKIVNNLFIIDNNIIKGKAIVFIHEDGKLESADIKTSPCKKIWLEFLKGSLRMLFLTENDSLYEIDINIMFREKFKIKNGEIDLSNVFKFKFLT